MTDPAPPDNFAEAWKQITDRLNQIQVGGSGLIGLAPGQAAVGTRIPPGHRAPTPVTRFGTQVNKNPYKTGDEQKPGGGRTTRSPR